ncbi:MAG: hypothetical protein ACAI44_27770 [Candidatus Sericytochromatia bacterium]
MSKPVNDPIPEPKPESLIALVFKFALYLGLLWFSVMLELTFWDVVVAQAKGGQDWFLAVDPSRSFPPMVYMFYLILGITALVSLVRLLRQLPYHPPHKALRLTLRGVTVLSFALFTVLVFKCEGARAALWLSYRQEIDSAVSRLKPGMSAVQAESRLKALRMNPRSSSAGAQQHELYLPHSISGPDSMEALRARLNYDAEGHLRSWIYTFYGYEPDFCDVLQEYPAKSSTPHPCADSEK